MFLIVGTSIMAGGLIAIMHFYIFRHIRVIFSKIILLVVGLSSMATITVHGIWLGLSIWVFGFFWLIHLENKKGLTDKRR